MATNDTKTVNLTLVKTPKPDIFLDKPDPLAQPMDGHALIAILGGLEALVDAFGEAHMAVDEVRKYATLHLHSTSAKGYRIVDLDNGIDAICFRATPSPYHYDVLYLRGCRAADRAKQEAVQDADWANADDDTRFELLTRYYEKEVGTIPSERLSGGFYVVTTAYGVPAWALSENIEKNTGTKFHYSTAFLASKAQTQQHIETCDCDGCTAVMAEGKRLQERFDPLPLLDIDRKVIPRPAATFADTPTTADAAKVTDALARAEKLGWGNGNPQGILVN